ncbi:MAG: NADH-quinone oxidoreductase subunit C [Pirellulales bacterium]
MSPSTVLLTPLNELKSYSLADFRARVADNLRAGNRLITMFGVPANDEAADRPTLHAVFINQGKLQQFCGRPSTGEAFESLSREFSEAHCFEREMHEQYGLAFNNHPWLKPIRFEGKNLRRLDDYPFYKIEGKEIHEVGVGPIHAGVIEPGHFRFMCYGEKVLHLEIHLGYQHRGAELLLKQTNARKIPPLIESIAGDSAVAYSLGFCRAWEALCSAAIPGEVELVRGVALELERVAMHLVGLSGLATDIAFLPGSSTYGRLRTSMINLSMRQCGSRFGRSWFRPDELRYPMLAANREDIKKTVNQVQADIAHINKLFQASATVRHRLVTTGTVETKLAREIGLVGMSGRASGLTCDSRLELPSGAYSQIPINLVNQPTGDCWARGLIRIREIDESLNWVLKAIEKLPDVQESKPRNSVPRPNTGVLSLEEGWRGEVVHYIETDGDSKIRHYKVQDPSIRNWFGLAQAVKNNAIYDFPICNKSFDLSYCGNDL